MTLILAIPTRAPLQNTALVGPTLIPFGQRKRALPGGVIAPPSLPQRKQVALSKTIGILKNLEGAKAHTPFSLTNQLYRVLYPREYGVIVYGSSMPQEGTEEYDFDLKVGQAIGRQRIGKRPLFVVTGGGPGAMQAAAEGALSVGSHSMGSAVDFPNQPRNNAVYPELVLHRTLSERIDGVGGYEHRAGFTVVVPGGTGTFHEILDKANKLAFNLTLYPCQKRIILADYKGFFTKPGGFMDFINHSVADGKTRQKFIDEIFRIAKTPEEVAQLLVEPDVSWTPGMNVRETPSNHFPVTVQNN